MEQSTKKKVIIGGALVVVAGVGGYFLYKYLKNKKEEQAKKDADAAAAAAAAASQNSGGGSGSGGGGGGGSTSSIPSGTDILAFQKFANSKGEKLTEDGKGGPKTNAAWAKYGADYAKSTSSNPKGYDQGYVDSWNAARKAGQATFVWLGKTYDSATGRATTAAATGETAIGKMAYPKGNYSNVRSSASAASGTFNNTFIGQVNSPNVIGKIKNLTLGSDKFRWYEVDLLTPLASSTAGLGQGNSFAKSGWVREDTITIK